MGRSGEVFEIKTTDSPLVNMLSSQHRHPPPLPVNLKPLTNIDGFYYNLYNNVWDVNYIFWYPFMEEERNQKFRFQFDIYSSFKERKLTHSCH